MANTLRSAGVAVAVFSFAADDGYQPPQSMVKDTVVAERLAEVILESVYGRDVIRREKPFHAELRGDVWVVTGTLAPGMKGGVAEIHISKKTGEVVYLIHEK
jgi:hypothetical protein